MKHVCILGAGMAGAILAIELLKRGNHSVTLLDIDSINDEFDRKIALEKNVDQGLTEQTTLAYGFGGSSNLWHGVLGLFDSDDWESIQEKVAFDGLRKEVEDGLPRLSVYFGKGLDVLRQPVASHNVQMSRWLDISRLNPKRYAVQLRPTRLREQIKRAKRQYPNRLTLRNNAVAIKLNANDQSSVESVVFKSDKGLEVLCADVFVVSAGALESPRLLKQSFQDTEFDNGLIGKGLMDHPHVIIGELKTPDRIFYRQHAVNRILARISNRIGLIVPVHERRSSKLNHSVIIRPSFGESEATSRAAIKTIITGGGSVLSIILACLSKRTFLRALVVLACEKFGIGIYTNRFLVSLQLEQLQDDRSRVEVTKGVDRYGRLIPKVKRYFSDELIEDLGNMKALVRQLCKNGSNFNEYDVGPDQFLSGSHHSGTCRMGISKEDSVINVNLKYHMLNNLYICDASVFRKIGNVNLSATIGLFAIRLARRLQC